MDDEAARLWFSTSLGASKAGEWILENKANKSSPALIHSLLSTGFDTTLSTVDEGVLDVTQCSLPFDRVERFMVRITKGMLVNFFPAYDYTAAEFDVRHVHQTVDSLKKLEPLRDMLLYFQRGNGVFQGRGGLTESGQSGVWIFLFYEAALFVVAHSKNNWGRPLADTGVGCGVGTPQ